MVFKKNSHHIQWNGYRNYHRCTRLDVSYTYNKNFMTKLYEFRVTSINSSACVMNSHILYFMCCAVNKDCLWFNVSCMCN